MINLPAVIRSSVLSAWASTTGCLKAGRRTEVPSATLLHTEAIAARVVKGSSLGFASMLSPTQRASNEEFSANVAIDKIFPKSGFASFKTRPRVGSKYPKEDSFMLFTNYEGNSCPI
jgi:hypothetical protein